ncbi:MAG: M56 family metallopeptidase [Blautia sp.]|nr:M56 family metallopeptidase [Blautia sp.]
MMGEFMTGILNTSVIVGVSIAVFSILLFFRGKRYSAKSRKTIWILMAFCLLVPFHLIPVPGAYMAEIPDIVLREAGIPEADHGGEAMMQGDVGQAAPVGVMQVQPLSEASGKEVTAADVAFVIWACVGAVMAVYLMAGYQRMRRKIRRWGYECEDAGIREILAEISGQCGMKRIPGLYILPDSTMGPFTTGIFRNIIVLPEEVQNEKDMRFILKHEALHCKNRDILWKLLFLLVCIIHWFNPLVWLLRRAAEQDMEIACDEEVVSGAAREDRREYSEVIMAWVERSQCRGSAVSTGYVRGVRFLKRRFESILNGGRKKKGILLVVIACVFVLLAGNMIHIQSGGTVYAGAGTPETSPEPGDFWEILSDDGKTVRFATGLELVFPEEWRDRIVFETENDNDVVSRLLVCEKGNAEAGIGGILFMLELFEYTEDVTVVMDGDVVFGLYKPEDREYVLNMDWPGDRQYSEEDQALIDAYLELSETVGDVTLNTGAMSGFTSCGIDDLEWVIYESQWPLESMDAMDSESDDSQSPVEADEPVSGTMQELERLMADFGRAYFNGDRDAVGGFLASGYEGAIEVYESSDQADELEIIQIKGLQWIEGQALADRYELSIEFRIPGEDSLTYLSVTWILENEVWKISGYGLEK